MGDSTSRKRWDIMPYVGTGELRFGMTRSDVRSLLGDDVKMFTKGALTATATATDAYDELCLHLYYDIEDRLEYIEAWGSCCIYYKEVALLNVPVQTVFREVAHIGLTPRYDDGYFFDDPGFCLYAPGDLVQAVGVYRRGYYEEHRTVPGHSESG